jgi:hypothetical protein
MTWQRQRYYDACIVQFEKPATMFNTMSKTGELSCRGVAEATTVCFWAVKVWLTV